jgi:hypothetical protein
MSLCTLCGLKNPLMCPYVPYVVYKIYMVKAEFPLLSWQNSQDEPAGHTP